MTFINPIDTKNEIPREIDFQSLDDSKYNNIKPFVLDPKTAIHANINNPILSQSAISTNSTNEKVTKVARGIIPIIKRAAKTFAKVILSFIGLVLTCAISAIVLPLVLAFILIALLIAISVVICGLALALPAYLISLLIKGIKRLITAIKGLINKKKSIEDFEKDNSNRINADTKSSKKKERLQYSWYKHSNRFSRGFRKKI